MNKRLAFLIDTRYCNDCKTCEIACKMERRLKPGIRWREVRKFENANVSYDGNDPVKYPDGISPHFAIHIPMGCNHCEKPECVTVCPMNAYSKTAMGPVIHNYQACIGCSKCVAACPYSAPVFDKDVQKSSKCDMCYDRMQEGMEPYCVQCCPNNALKIDTYENLVAHYGEAQDLSGVNAGGTPGSASINTLLPEGKLTNPSIVVKHW